MEGRSPLHVAVFNLVELLFKPCCVLDIEDVGKALDEEVVDYESELGRVEFAFELFNILTILDYGHDRRICRRPTYTLLLERLDQRRFGKSRRRFREVLFRRQTQESQRFALLNAR